jgi:hypothetical protein
VTLSVPPIPEGMAAAEAAQLYAAAGWYVGPFDPDWPKHPGRLLGKGWHEQTSRDPVLISWWFATNPGAGVFLHVGRSGAVAFDVDTPSKITGVLGDTLAAAVGPVQLTRDERHAARLHGTGPLVYRGHYLYLQPAGRDIGNSAGLTGRGWGDVRGRNGVIIVAPSPHPNATYGGIYRWIRPGTLPLLPDVVAVLLRDAAPEVDPASRARLAGLRASVAGASAPGLLQRGPVRRWNDRMAQGESRHPAMAEVAAYAYREALAGLYPLAEAEDVLRAVFLEAVADPELGSGAVRSDDDALREFEGLSVWALGQAEAADPEETRALALGRTTVPEAKSFVYGPGDANFPGRVDQGRDVPVLADAPWGTPDAPGGTLVLPGAVEPLGSLPLVADLSSWERTDLTPYLDGTWAPPPPGLLLRTDGQPLLYPGRTHSIYGEPESGKTWIGLLACAQAIRAHRHVLIVDLESDPGDLTFRLLLLGCTAFEIAVYLVHVSPDTKPLPGTADDDAWQRTMWGRRYAVVLIDALAGAMSLFGLDPKSDSDVTTFYRGPMVMLARTGAVLIVIDHVIKDPDSRGRWSTGSERKIGALTGAAFSVRSDKAQAFGVGRRGESGIWIAKDRAGGLRGLAGDPDPVSYTHLTLPTM